MKQANGNTRFSLRRLQPPVYTALIMGLGSIQQSTIRKERSITIGIGTPRSKSKYPYGRTATQKLMNDWAGLCDLHRFTGFGNRNSVFNRRVFVLGKNHPRYQF